MVIRIKSAYDCPRASEIRKYLPDRFADFPIFTYEEIGSTNTEAKAYAIAHPDCDGAVFLADRQSAGRGRMGRRFLSEPGVGLYLSFLLKREDAGREVLSETAYAAVRTARAIEAVAPELHPRIKWVNDLLLNEKKIAGILAEGVILPNGSFSHLVVGVGINVKKRLFPPELEAIAASLGDFSLREISREALAAEMIVRFYPEEETTVAYMRDYRERLAYVGEEIVMISGDTREKGILCGVTDEGYLLVTDKNGKEKILSTGEISIRKRHDG